MKTARKGSRNRSSVNRPDDDFYPTPREAIVPFLQACPGIPHRVWEPACGDGAICRVLEEFGYQVVASNLTDRGCGETGIDFLSDNRALWAPAIITNPPASHAMEFAFKATFMLQAEFTAMLFRTKFLEGRQRYLGLFRMNPPAEIYQFINRVTFYAGDTPKEDQPGWNTEAFAWFVWRKGQYDEPRVRWIWTEGGEEKTLPGNFSL